MAKGTDTGSKTVGEIKLKKAVEVVPDTSVFDSCKVMTKNRMECVLVVDTTADYGARVDFLKRPEIVGILTVKDVVNRVASVGRNPSETKVSEVMTSPVNFVDTSTTLVEVANIMNRHDFKQMPVVSKFKIEGLVLSRMVNLLIMRELINRLSKNR